MWNFAEVSPWHVSSAPKHEEFFSSDNRSIAHSLVREATQNSGDAAEPQGSPVELRFRFLEVECKPLKERYLRGLVEHLQAVALLTPSLEPAIAQLDGDKTRVLLVEDFGTSGLTGSYDNPRAKGKFNSFWRRVGQSEKGGAEGGRHGVGKSTVASASAIKTVFGMTVRHDDGKRLLYGQATLRPHEIVGRDALFDSYGVFASNAPPAAPLPFEGSAVDQFVESFGLSRHDESGLSLVIPLPVEELTSESLVIATIEHCFHQILEGMLTVVIDGVKIDRDTIEALVADRPELSHLQEAVALSRDVIAMQPPMVESSSDSRDRLDEGEFDVAQMLAMRNRWLEGGIVGVKLHVPSIKPRGKDQQAGEAWLFMRKLEDPKKAAETYIRGRLLVPERRLTGRNCLSLMLAKDGPLSTMLGDSEQPSHTRWIQAKLKEGYVAPEYPFRRARQALYDLEKLLVGAKEGEALPDLLKPYFFSPTFGKPDKAPGSQPPKPPAPTPPVLEIRKVESGFVAERKDQSQETIKRVDIAVRYLVRKGKPKFRPGDFDLSSPGIGMSVENGSADITVLADDGCLVLRDVQPGFRLRLAGFDANRDLYVHAESVNTPEDEEAAA